MARICHRLRIGAVGGLVAMAMAMALSGCPAQEPSRVGEREPVVASEAPSPPPGPAAAPARDPKRMPPQAPASPVPALTPPAFDVCGGGSQTRGTQGRPLETPAPRVAPLQLGPSPLIGVHCGARAALLWAVDSPGGVTLHEALSIEPRVTRPDGQGRPGPFLVTDLDDDGADDLLLAFPVTAARQSPAGGSLLWLPGSPTDPWMLGPPQRLPGVHAVALVEPAGALVEPAGALVEPAGATHPSQGVVVVHREDARLAAHDELWRLSPGPALERKSLRPLPPGTRHVVSVDFDGDGKADFVASNARGALSLLGSAPAPAAGDAGTPMAPQPATATDLATRALATGDLDGDGASDAVLISGAGLRWLAANRAPGAQGDPKPSALEGASCGEDGCGTLLRMTDADGDGRADLLTFEAPELVLYRQVARLRFERRPLSTVRGEGVALLDFHVAEVTGDQNTDLILLYRTEPRGHGLAIVPSWFRHVAGDSPPRPVHIDPESPHQAIPPLPLRAKYTLP